ncbi:hypothetical protein HDU91_005545 [Kappamyces sp. JEL0680]|nr:hypothetical protein HDU91_005545 [Kappamyces sp. JEL0680]
MTLEKEKLAHDEELREEELAIQKGRLKRDEYELILLKEKQDFDAECRQCEFELQKKNFELNLDLKQQEVAMKQKEILLQETRIDKEVDMKQKELDLQLKRLEKETELRKEEISFQMKINKMLAKEMIGAGKSTDEIKDILTLFDKYPMYYIPFDYKDRKMFNLFQEKCSQV